MIERQQHDANSFELEDNLGNRHSDDFEPFPNFNDDGAQAGLLTDEHTTFSTRPSFLSRLPVSIPFFRRRQASSKFRSRAGRHRAWLRPSSFRRIFTAFVVCVTTLILVDAIFFPSYTHPPSHYNELRNRAQATVIPGRANSAGQKVYIAASIFDKDGALANGAWGDSILGLIEILGPENVYLSIYENDAGEVAEAALQNLEKKIKCAHTLKFDKHLSLDEVPHVRLPDGSDRVKRIVYLSEVRNRALRPLAETSTKYDKMLYINDVIFDPVDAAQLLFSTNVDANGIAQYRAACALDFINPFKYYDTFATRDYEGYGIGLPFYPWFTSAGEGISRKDVYASSDAVRVRSCWGGMVAFDARFFQSLSIVDAPTTAGSEGPSKLTAPYLFRAEDDLYWDASECCLIHADIQSPDQVHSGIYMNPYVRVAYDKRTLSWLGLTRRFERLYSPVHYVITKAVGMPWYNPRRAESAGERVNESVWVPDASSPKGGSFEIIQRTASHSGFCGRRALQVLKSDITSKGKNWEFLPIPS